MSTYRDNLEAENLKLKAELLQAREETEKLQSKLQLALNGPEFIPRNQPQPKPKVTTPLPSRADYTGGSFLEAFRTQSDASSKLILTILITALVICGFYAFGRPY